jgi:DNA-binding transcriptional LysR family regulator/predicted ATPase
MELEARLRAFAAVAREGSFSRAAESLYVSQPAISKHVAALEAKVGRQLLVRGGRQVTLTPAGHVLSDYVLRAEALLANARRALGDGADAEIGTLSLAASGIPGTYLLPPALGQFTAMYPRVEVDFRLATSSGALELVRAHDVELAVVAGVTTPPELQAEALVEDEIVLIGPPELGRRRFRPRDIEAFTWVIREEGSATRAAVDAARAQLGLDHVETLELPSWEAVKLAVARGAGIAPISRFALDVEVACGAVAVLDVPRWHSRRTVSVVRAQGVLLSPPAERFVALLRERFAPDEDRVPPNSNLRLPPTSFVGRDAELAQLTALLEREPVRLVTLTGMPGAGKTRLAIEAAARVVDAFPGGVRFVDLAPVVDPEHVPAAVAAALGAHGTHSLAGRVREKRTLLVLDNFEQVADAARHVAGVLRDTRGSKILVTSRVPLRLRGERLLEVAPLPEPQALELFYDRAREASPRYAPDGSERELCERLDRLPLALELVAAHAAELPPAALLDGLHGALSTLRSRDEPERHRTLNATIAWSYDRLSERSQHVFRLLSVFSGGWTVDAAKSVTGADARTLAELVEQHLVARGDRAGRFRMPETIRQFASDRMTEQGEAADARRRHAVAMLRFAEEARAGLEGAERATWLDTVEAELGNIRSALASSERADHAEYRLRLVSALDQFWAARGPVAEIVEVLRSGLAHVDSAEVRADALRPYSWFLADTGDLDGASAAAEERRALCEAMGDARGVVGAIGTLADISERQGEIEQAGVLFEQAAELGRAAGAVHTLTNLGGFYERHGEPARARASYEELLRVARDRGDSFLEAHALGDLAGATAHEGRFAQALPLLLESLMTWHDLGDLRVVVWVMSEVADTYAGLREPERAVTLAAAADALADQAGIPFERPGRDVFERASAALDPTTRELATQRGLAMSLDEAVELATRGSA